MNVKTTISFSSTVLDFRGLTERGHSREPHGRRGIGILLFQDAALFPLLLFIPLLSGNTSTIAPMAIGKTLVFSLGFVLAVVAVRHFLGRWMLPALTTVRSTELDILFAVVSIGTVTLAAYSLG